MTCHTSDVPHSRNTVPSSNHRIGHTRDIVHRPKTQTMQQRGMLQLGKERKSGLQLSHIYKIACMIS